MLQPSVTRLFSPRATMPSQNSRSHAPAGKQPESSKTSFTP